MEHAYEFDNDILYITKQPYRNAQRYQYTFSGIHNLAEDYDLNIDELFYESNDYNKDFFQAKLICRVIDKNGVPFENGKIQVYNVDTKETLYFKDMEDLRANLVIKGKVITDWADYGFSLPIVDLKTYLYFRPHQNWDCNFEYKGIWYILPGEDTEDVDFYPNYWVMTYDEDGNRNTLGTYKTPLELLENFVLHDGTRLWDVLDETVFEWYRLKYSGQSVATHVV